MQQALKNPNVVFSSPERLEGSERFTPAQKRAILLQWKNQLQQLLIADEENMILLRATAGENAECLRRVSDSMSRLPM